MLLLSLVDIGLVALEKTILNCRGCINTIYLIPPLGKKHEPSFDKLNFSSTNETSYQIQLKLAKWFWRRRF